MFNKRGAKTPMKCDEVKPALSAYQDNELDTAAGAAVRTHLEECQNCRSEYRELQILYRRLETMPEKEPAANFTSLIMGKVKEREQRHWFSLPSFAYSLVFLFFFILGLIITANLKDNPAPQQEEMFVSNILIESQDLGLINIQDNTFALLVNGGKKNGK